MANEITYRRHLIKSMKTGGRWSARAFRGTAAIGAVLSDATEELAIKAVQTELDAAEDQRLASRVDGYPTAAEVRAALATIRMTDEQRAMLTAHLKAADHVMTATELAGSNGAAKHVTVGSPYGKLARKLAEELQWDPPVDKKGKEAWAFALATNADDGEDVDTVPDATNVAHWRWRLRPEIVAALRGAA